MGNDKQSLYTIITPEQAKKQNQRETAGGSNSEYMSFKGDPRYPSEYFSPEELDASVVKAFKSKEEEEAFKRKQLEKQVATMMNAYDWKRPLATRGPNQGDTSLQNIAAASIGAPLLLFNPATSTIATGPIAHAIEVAMNPLAAETMLGAFLGTGVQAAGITAGIYNASNTIDKWRNGNFDLYDIPYFALDAASTIPVFNTVAGLADDAVRMTQNAYRTQRAARNATKPMTHGDPGLAQDYINAAGNAEGIHVNKNTAIVNQQQSGSLKSHHPSKLTEAELQGSSKHDRTNIRERVGKDLGQAARAIEGSKPYIIDDAKFLEFMKRNYAMRNPGQDYARVYKSTYTEHPTINDMKTFIDQLPDTEINPIFKTVKDPKGIEWETPILTKYRHYLSTEEGLPGDDLSTKDIQKLLTFYEDHLNTHVTGKLKKIPLWHNSKRSFDRFDLSHLGEHTGNTGAYGPGNYFNANVEYGFSKHFSQPFYVTDINQLMWAQDASDYKHLISPRSATVDKVFYPKNGRFATVQGYSLIDDPLVAYPIYKGEVAVPRNTGIKSLYPHSSRFVRQPDGTVTFTPTDWSDVRFNFKNGGRLLKIENPDQ